MIATRNRLIAALRVEPQDHIEIWCGVTNTTDIDGLVRIIEHAPDHEIVAARNNPSMFFMDYTDLPKGR